jgi:hypothetical protein
MKQNNALHKVSQDAESRHQEVLLMLLDQAEEYRRNLEQSMELTNDFFALRRGELEHWKTDDKSRRRSDIVEARDEVAHGGQVVADLAMIDNLMARMQAGTSVYAECFKEAYGVTISQAKLRERRTAAG